MHHGLFSFWMLVDVSCSGMSHELSPVDNSSEKSTNGMRFTSFGLFSGKLSPVIMTKQKSGWFAAMLFFLYNKAKK